MSYPKPRKQTAHLTCPGCWSNTLAETVAAPTHQLGGVAWYQCLSCSWAGSSDDLRAPTTAAEIRDCLDEDKHRGSRTGGSDKGPKREDKLRQRSLRQVTWTDEASRFVKQESLEPKGRIRSIRGLPDYATGEKVREAVEKKLLG